MLHKMAEPVQMMRKSWHGMYIYMYILNLGLQSVALIPVVLLLAALPTSLVNLPDRSQTRPERQR